MLVYYLGEVNFAVCGADSFTILVSNSTKNTIKILRVSAANDARTNVLCKQCRICTWNQCCAFSSTARWITNLYFCYQMLMFCPLRGYVWQQFSCPLLLFLYVTQASWCASIFIAMMCLVLSAHMGIADVLQRQGILTLRTQLNRVLIIIVVGERLWLERSHFHKLPPSSSILGKSPCWV